MNRDYTHITVILDRTGSMESIRDDTIGGFNSFLDEQKQAGGKATLTLVQFDTQDPYEVVHRFAPLAEVPGLTRETYVPRAATPLLDALGRGINDLEQSLAAIAEEERPGKVVFAIVTDGKENSSSEFSREQVNKMITARKEMPGWQFVFLSADLEAIEEAQSLGVSADATLAFERSSEGNEAAWGAFARRTRAYREAGAEEMRFEAEDRRHPDDPVSKGKG